MNARPLVPCAGSSESVPANGRDESRGFPAWALKEQAAPEFGGACLTTCHRDPLALTDVMRVAWWDSSPS